MQAEVHTRVRHWRREQIPILEVYYFKATNSEEYCYLDKDYQPVLYLLFTIEVDLISLHSATHLNRSLYIYQIGNILSLCAFLQTTFKARYHIIFSFKFWNELCKSSATHRTRMNSWSRNSCIVRRSQRPQHHCTIDKYFPSSRKWRMLEAGKWKLFGYYEDTISKSNTTMFNSQWLHGTNFPRARKTGNELTKSAKNTTLENIKLGNPEYIWVYPIKPKVQNIASTS